MSDQAPRKNKPSAAAQPRQRHGEPASRQVATVAARHRRGGMMLLGVVLVLGAAFGFWFVLRSIDERHEYLMTTRTIDRWDIATSADFTVVEANVGAASAVAADRVGELVGKSAAGTIPEGTIVAEGLFEDPPLSGDSDSDKVLISVTLPAEDAPFGTLETGDKIALLGAAYADDAGTVGAFGVIGVLTLELVQDGDVYYLVSPQEALAIQDIASRYSDAADRRIWKMGTDVTVEHVQNALDALGGGPLPPSLSTITPGGLQEPGSGSEPVDGQ